MKGVTPPKKARAPGTYARSKETIAQILKAAEEVLIEQGYSALTLRRVAERCGVRVGNISYHFPTKYDLMTGLLESLLDDYADRREQVKGLATRDRGERAEEYIKGALLQN